MYRCTSTCRARARSRARSPAPRVDSPKMRTQGRTASSASSASSADAAILSGQLLERRERTRGARGVVVDAQVSQQRGEPAVRLGDLLGDLRGDLLRGVPRTVLHLTRPGERVAVPVVHEPVEHVGHLIGEAQLPGAQGRRVGIARGLAGLSGLPGLSGLAGLPGLSGLAGLPGPGASASPDVPPADRYPETCSDPAFPVRPQGQGHVHRQVCTPPGAEGCVGLPGRLRRLPRRLSRRLSRRRPRLVAPPGLGRAPGSAAATARPRPSCRGRGNSMRAATPSCVANSCRSHRSMPRLPTTTAAAEKGSAGSEAARCRASSVTSRSTRRAR